ncbi:biliverdin-producing heme oxygenase [Aquiflexum sp. TKW24L]|uniref:biliverdin-producing heme oxygenase n=1 Tax=Aquiflexum sp. TKW24L TaxID=2942212 RepID=UPI0020C0B78A|nr:biliverdin-producing heme oxygenase [Aquiflexum sp. TKW24L]
MFIQNLRALTAECHKQLETNKLSLALLSDHVNESIYHNYLIRLYGFVKGFEQFMYPILPPHFKNVSERKKAHFIEEDLENYGAAYNKNTFLSESFFKETYPDIYGAAGALYVLEGSTLGGQIIVKHLQKKLTSGFVNSAYFAAYKQKTGSMWKEFLQQLTTLPPSVLEEKQIIAGAIITFRIIDGLLNDNPQTFTTYEHRKYHK